MPKLRVNGIVEESIVDGPGLRFVIFTQGCPHGCPGCHNPETHSASGGYDVSTEALFARFRENPLLSGITFSGGEPFEQATALTPLARDVHASGKTVVAYTGYTLEQLLDMAKKDSALSDLLAEVDTLIDGPYVQSLRDLELLYRGSTNQRIVNREGIQNSLAHLLGTR